MRLSHAVLASLLFSSAAVSALGQTQRPPTLETDPANWPTYSGDHSSKRHSPLTEINPANVGTLQAKWVYNVYGQRDLQPTPVVVNGVMYISMFNRLDAIDASTGKVIWQYHRTPVSTSPQRGTSVWNNRVFVVTTDRHLVALDARNGAVLWEVPTGEGLQPAGGAPLIAGDKLIIGGNQPSGFVQGYDAMTGKHLWTWRATPSKDDPAYATWGGAEPDGGPMWLSGSYDPDLNLIYYGTGDPDPSWAGDTRPGDNLYSVSVVALNPDTGERKWHFQFTPHNVHDWDSVQMPVLVDAPWKGQPRKLMLWANRNGFYYILDRVTGEFLQATPHVSEINWLFSMDEKGRPTADPSRAPSVSGTLVCPSTAGGTNWPAPTFDPVLKTFFLVVQEGCGINFRDSAGNNASGGYVESPDHPWQLYTRAIDAFTGEKKWDYKQVGSTRYGPGLLSTAAGLVFSGEKSGQFTALDSRNGEPLWNFYTGGVITSGPMTYQVDGQQYIGLISGSNVFAFGLPDRPAAGATASGAAAMGGGQ